MNTQNLTDEQIVDIELAKGRCHNVIDRINGYPNIDNAGYLARATTNTVKEILVNAGVTTEANFYNQFTEQLLAKEGQIADMLDIDLDEADADAEAELTA